MQDGLDRRKHTPSKLPRTAAGHGAEAAIRGNGPPLTIALAMDRLTAWSRTAVAGLASWSQDRLPWSFVWLPELAGQEEVPDPQALLDPLPAAVVGTFHPGPVADAVVSSGVPVIGMLGTPIPGAWMAPGLDEEAIGRAAGEHLLEAGYRTLIGVGHDHSRRGWWSGRWAGLRAVAELAEVPCHEWRMESRADASSLGDWLHQLLQRTGAPVGIMAGNDLLGARIIAICHHARLAIPQQVGVIGVDDDPAVSPLTWPGLSSVRAGHEQIGRCAGELLQRRLAGEAEPAPAPLLRPSGIAARGSTDLAAMADPLVSAACAALRQHPGESIERLLAGIGAHRRTVERRFLARLGRSLLAEQRRLRVELTLPSLRQGGTVAAAAALVGCSTDTLTSAYIERLGLTPGQCRNA
jgi:LacI family transcriptional regulator